jgi:hypothetical protein
VALFAAVHLIPVIIGVPLIVAGLLVTAWINDWMKRGRKRP